MNSVIQKCVEELAKDSPRLDYVRGMLDTLLSMNEQPVQVLATSAAYKPVEVRAGVMPLVDGIPPVQPLDKIKKIAEASAQ